MQTFLKSFPVFVILHFLLILLDWLAISCRLHRALYSLYLHFGLGAIMTPKCTAKYLGAQSN